MQLAEEVALGKLRPHIPPGIRGLANLLPRCWAADPRHRPHISAVVTQLRLEKVALERELRKAAEDAERVERGMRRAHRR